MESGQRLRDLSSKGREDGGHAQPSHPLEDPVLELHLQLVPAGSQTSSKASDVAHPEPGQEGGTREVLLEVLLAQAQLAPHSAPDGLQAVEGEGKVDPIESHPVNVSLPVRPLPPHVAVARRADILVVPDSLRLINT